MTECNDYAARARLISIIIVNWNGAAHLRTCLPSLREQSYPHIEIVVVDNGSTDDSRNVAGQNGARWLPLSRNFGLGPAMNRGAAFARGAMLLFVNNDMRFDRGFVAHLERALGESPDVFAADGLQYTWDGDRIGHAASRLCHEPPDDTLTTEIVPGLHFYQQAATEQLPVFMASAASMLVRRPHFEEIGGFDERLPLGYEDVELCWRAWLRGWRIVSVPEAVCWHRVGASTGTPEGMRRHFNGVLKGRLLLATKLLPVRYGIAIWLLSAAGVAKDLGQICPRSAAGRIAAMAQTARQMPGILRERKQIFATARTTPQQQLDHMLRLSVEGENGFAAHKRPC